MFDHFLYLVAFMLKSVLMLWEYLRWALGAMKFWANILRISSFSRGNADLPSVSPSPSIVSFETLYGRRFMLSTQLIVLNYSFILSHCCKHHSFFRNLLPSIQWNLEVRLKMGEFINDIIDGAWCVETSLKLWLQTYLAHCVSNTVKTRI